jgi:hypothetical protein
VFSTTAAHSNISHVLIDKQEKNSLFRLINLELILTYILSLLKDLIKPCLSLTMQVFFALSRTSIYLIFLMCITNMKVDVYMCVCSGITIFR